MTGSTPIPDDEPLVFGGLTDEDMQVTAIKRLNGLASELRGYAFSLGAADDLSEEVAVRTFTDGFRDGQATAPNISKPRLYANKKP